jgi:NAD(P)H-dependent FMN reductase
MSPVHSNMETYYIPIVLGSVRRNRESIKVGRFALECLRQFSSVRSELLDLREMDIPIMEERLRFRRDPPPGAVLFSSEINTADAIVIVAPEYNGGYPGVLKNALEYLKDEYRRKPCGIITVSAVETGGILCLAALRQVMLQLGGLPIPASLLVPRVQETFDPEGKPRDHAFLKQAKSYFDELLWFTEALAAQRRKAAAATA